ncbi:MAG: exodeoxyribonuclease VII large subunit [Nitrospira sp.]|nr:MAG: exodeoxyribonuclease VII large subunit [Nitrospira sp.]
MRPSARPSRFNGCASPNSAEAAVSVRFATMQTSFHSAAILSVSDVVRAARDRLEQAFTDVWIEGEVSGLRAPGSGHLYLTLKDAQAQIKAVIFRGVATRLRFGIQDGLSVVARGRLTIYEARGDFQIVLDVVEPKGLGALQLAFEQLKERLAREGLFEESRKRPLPFLPRRVGLVTSLHGAAVRDMLTVLQRRCPAIGIIIVPVLVQGDGAARQVADGIKRLNAAKLVDVMIVGRGGGSIEDLWTFNEEVVVRAIAASRVPVVSAVGHEIDTTLADFAADYRAPTPSAAAEAVVPVLSEVIEGLSQRESRLVRALQGRLVGYRHELAGHQLVIQGVRLRFQRVAQRLDDRLEAAQSAMRTLLAAHRLHAVKIHHGLRIAGPAGWIHDRLVVVPQLLKRARQGIAAVLGRKQLESRHVLRALGGLNPLAILARGYSVVCRVRDGRVVRSVSDVVAEEEILARLHEGQLVCTIRKLLPQG